MLWLTTCASIALLLATFALLGWRRERLDEALSDEVVQRSVRPQPQPPTRKLGFSGTLDGIRSNTKRRAG